MTDADASGQVGTPLFLVVPRMLLEIGLSGTYVTKKRAGKRRGFGRVERLASGRYRAAYTGPDGRLYRAPQTFLAKDDAIAWLSARRAEISMEVWAPDVAARAASRRSAPTFREYADTWLKNRKTKGGPLRPTTHQQYRMLLETHIYPTFENEWDC